MPQGIKGCKALDVPSVCHHRAWMGGVNSAALTVCQVPYGRLLYSSINRSRILDQYGFTKSERRAACTIVQLLTCRGLYYKFPLYA